MSSQRTLSACPGHKSTLPGGAAQIVEQPPVTNQTGQVCKEANPVYNRRFESGFAYRVADAAHRAAT